MPGATEVDAARSNAEPDTPPSPREERRRLRLEMTRTQVLDVAERAFATVGFHNTTIKSIAERCEIAVGTIYTLFDDKDSVYEAVLRRRGAILHGVTRARASEPGPADLTLVAVAELHVRFFREHPDWAGLASALGSGSRATASNAEPSHLYAAGHRVVCDDLAEVIARGQHEGRIRDGDPRALALVFLGMLETFHRLDNTGRADQPDYTLAEFLDLVRAAFSS
ncbi:TetR/AcrR family transcriptional regulator [Nocardia sp. NBC_01377]|uniref:TetR/AcrR family transcriptional regulator n=2 Tax=Nocardiaceae TaxID=85025 RepID=UPI001C237E70|nr:TetR/AcrR family transcriptional regulator [Nocardia noduli]